jgi:hypothetical protein
MIDEEEQFVLPFSRYADQGLGRIVGGGFRKFVENAVTEFRLGDFADRCVSGSALPAKAFAKNSEQHTLANATRTVEYDNRFTVSNERTQAL